MHFLVDTNVALVANGKSSAGPACIIAAIERLEQLVDSELLVLDDAFHILNEYSRKLNSNGQPGPGDAFYQWALQNHRNSQHCELVMLEIAEDNSFAAYPTDPELVAFDLSDRKFVAAALTHHANPPIVNATDKDWHEHQAALSRNDVQIAFLCMEEMTKPRQ